MTNAAVACCCNPFVPCFATFSKCDPNGDPDFLQVLDDCDDPAFIIDTVYRFLQVERVCYRHRELLTEDPGHQNVGLPWHTGQFEFFTWPNCFICLSECQCERTSYQLDLALQVRRVDDVVCNFAFSGIVDLPDENCRYSRAQGVVGTCDGAVWGIDTPNGGLTLQPSVGIDEWRVRFPIRSGPSTIEIDWSSNTGQLPRCPEEIAYRMRYIDGAQLTALADGMGSSEYGRYLRSVLDDDVFALMTRPRDVPRGSRAFGWDHRSPYSSNRGESLSDAAFGHGGFTGTVMWIDPEKDRVLIFLSNRLHPDGKGSVNKLAGKIATIIGSTE